MTATTFVAMLDQDSGPARLDTVSKCTVLALKHNQLQRLTGAGYSGKSVSVAVLSHVAPSSAAITRSARFPLSISCAPNPQAARLGSGLSRHTSTPGWNT